MSKIASARRTSKNLILETVDNYERIAKIGEGSFSIVWRGTLRDGVVEHPWVIKDVALAKMSPEDRDAAIDEVELHSKLKHPNIIKYVKAIRCKPESLSIVLEMASGGDLSAFLKKRFSSKNFLVEREALVWFSQVASAIEYLHNQGIIHRDVKTANIFLASNGLTKLGDFNLSKKLPMNAKKMEERTCSTPCGTPMYNSPEQWLRGNYNLQVDIWALGCLLYELLTCQGAFVSTSMEGLEKTIRECTYGLSQLASVSKDTRDLLSSLLTVDPRRRITSEKILKNPMIVEAKKYSFAPEEIGGAGIQLVAAMKGPGVLRTSSTIASICEDATEASSAPKNESASNLDSLTEDIEAAILDDVPKPVTSRIPVTTLSSAIAGARIPPTPKTTSALEKPKGFVARPAPVVRFKTTSGPISSVAAAVPSFTIDEFGTKIYAKKAILPHVSRRSLS